MMNTAGCDQRSAGIGDIAYVKDLLTENIVTTKLRCSKFGFGHSPFLRFGWVCVYMMFVLFIHFNDDTIYFAPITGITEASQTTTYVLWHK